MEEDDEECLLQPLVVVLDQLCLLVSANLNILKALGLLSTQRLTQRACLAERE